MHLIIAFYASPKKIEILENLIQHKMKYEWEGEMRGYTRPFLSKLPLGFYDIRCKEEIAPFILRDINATLCEPRHPRVYFRRWGQEGAKPGQMLSLDHTRNASRLIYLGVKVLRFITRLKYVQRAEGPSQYPLEGWHYCWFIGAWPDARDEKGREVL